MNRILRHPYAAFSGQRSSIFIPRATAYRMALLCFLTLLSRPVTIDDELLTGVDTPRKKQEAIIANKDASDEFVTIPRFSDRISAGCGLVPVNEVEIKVAFRRDWIKKKGNPEKMSLIRVSGDSMEPTLMPEDLVLINHGHNHHDPQGGIYTIALDDVILIKRLQVVYPSGSVKVISDNAKYDSVELSQDQVKIYGRVIWFGREI